MEIFSIFPIPIGVFKLPELSEDQMSWIISQDSRPNLENRTSENSCLLDHAVLESLRANMNSCIKEYTDDISKISNNVNVKITQSWCNYNSMGDSHHRHCHPNSILSGVYYVQTDEEDKINFYNDAPNSNGLELIPTEYNEYNSKSWWLPATQGTLVLFPSDLQHSVSKRTHNGPDRISLSFNTFFTGTIGTKDGLTLLHL